MYCMRFCWWKCAKVMYCMRFGGARCAKVIYCMRFCWWRCAKVMYCMRFGGTRCAKVMYCMRFCCGGVLKWCTVCDVEGRGALKWCTVLRIFDFGATLSHEQGMSAHGFRMIRPAFFLISARRCHMNQKCLLMVFVWEVLHFSKIGTHMVHAWFPISRDSI